MAVIMACAWGGSGHYLVKDNITSANVQASHTIMCRVKWTATTTTASYWPAVLCTSAATSGSFVGRLASDPDGTNRTRGARFSTGVTYNRVTHTGSFGDTTTWRHLAMVYNSSTQIVEYYIDGVSIGTISSTTTFVAADTAGAFGALATGKIADLALYSRALTAGEVLQMASYRVQSVTSNCLGFYRMDTNSTGGTAEGSAADTSGSANTLTANTAAGGTGFTFSTADNPPQPENPQLVGVTANSGSTLSGTLSVLAPLVGATANTGSTLSGSLNTLKPLAATTANTGSTVSAWIRPRWGRRVETINPLNYSPGAGLSASSPWTMMVWANIVSFPSASDAIRFNAFPFGGGNATVALGGSKISGSDTVRIQLTDDNGTSQIFHSPITTAGTWNHLALTYDGAGNAVAYLNGTSVATASSVVLAGSWGPFNFSNQNTTSTGVGEFAHAKIFPATLTASQVVAEMTYIQPHQAVPYVWWQLAWNNVTLDSSGNGRTITNTTSTEAQSEAPGSLLTLLSSTANTGSTLAGALNTTKPLVSATTVTSSALAGTMTSIIPLVGTNANTGSTLAATPTAVIAATAAGNTSSALAGSLNTQKELASTANTGSTLAGAMTALLATTPGNTSSALAATLFVQLPIVGQNANTGSTLSGTLLLNGQFAATANTGSTLAGNLTQTLAIDGLGNTGSTLSGALSQAFAVAGTGNTGSTLAAQLAALVQGTGNTSSTLTGALGYVFQLAATGATSSQLAAAIQALLAATGLTGSTLSGTLSLLQSMVGTPGLTSSQLTGALIVNLIRALSASASSGSLLIGALTVTVSASASGNVVTDGEASAYYGEANVLGPARGRPWPPRPR